MSDSMREWPSEKTISREAILQTLEAQTVTIDRLERENDKLRGIIAKSDMDCVYCGLPKKDMGRCYLGFPGCGRADDLMNGDDNGPQPEPTI